MVALAENLEVEQLTETERQFQRVNVRLFGRFMREDKSEFPCQVTNMSPGTASVISPNSGEIGETIIAYMDHVGRIEGKILRIFHGGFSMSVNATPQKRDKLAAKITWIANRHELNLPEDRRHDRIVPTTRHTDVKLEDGRVYQSRLIDLSLSGAALDIQVRPAIGTLVMLGHMRGRVVRHFDEGIAIEFAILQTHDSLKNFIRQEF